MLLSDWLKCVRCRGSALFQIPEYCKSLEESEIADQAFPLIFAFDEVVALGYRESVNLAQIRTFTEMDSHEEKVFQAVRQVWQSCDACHVIAAGNVYGCVRFLIRHN